MSDAGQAVATVTAVATRAVAVTTSAAGGRVLSQPRAAFAGHEVAGELLATLATEHPVLASWSVRDQVMAATWLAGYRSVRTRRAYAGDLAAWLDWLTARGIDVLAARTRGLLAAADTDTGPTRLRAAAAIRLLLHQGLRVDELARASVADLGHDRGHRTLTVTRKGGHRVALVLPPATTAALDTYLASRVATAAISDVATGTDRVASWPTVTSPNATAAGVTGPLLATSTGGRMDQAAFWHLVRRLARAAGIEHWAALSPHSLRHTAITLALDAGASLRDVQDFAGHRDPRTTRRYDRSRHSLDRNAACTLAAYLA